MHFKAKIAQLIADILHHNTYFINKPYYKVQKYIL